MKTVVSARRRRRGSRLARRQAALVAALAAALPALAAAAPAAAAPGAVPEVSHAVHSDTSPPLRSLRPLPPHRGGGPFEVRRRQNQPFGAVTPLAADPVQQLQAPAAVTPATASSWDGVSNADNDIQVVPPDTNGDVGPNDYVQWVNLSFEIWDKSGASRYGPAAGNTLWQGFGGVCETTNEGDPIVVYDRLADRWLFSQFAFATAGGNPKQPFYQCLAVSTTGDPTGSYHRYAFQINAATKQFPDYPKFGVWPDGYYMSTNNFSNRFFAGAGAYAFDRAKMLAGEPATMISFGLPSQYEGLLPSHLTGPTPPPAGAPNYFGAVDTASSLGTGSTFQLWRFHADFTTPADSTFTGPVNVAVPQYKYAFCGAAWSSACVPQPGTSRTLDPLSDRLMNRLSYRNFGDHESLVVTHTVNVGEGGDRAGMRWYELRAPATTPVIAQLGTFAPADDVNRWMGSVAMNGVGDIALGYSASSGSSVYPSVRYTGRLAGDAPGTMTVAETPLVTGAGAQTGYSRWGDYSSMSVDPSDDTTFWYTQEYYSATSSRGWKTRIGSFRLDGGGADTTPPETTINSGPSGLTNNASPSFAFSSNEAGSTFECKLDGPGAATGTFASCTSPKAYASLADGSYTFSVRATDLAGNTDPTPATRSFTVDTTAPDTVIDSGPSGAVNDASPSFTFHSTETASTFECKLDGPGATTGTFASCTSPKAYSSLADGEYTFSVRAIDAAGNTDPAPATRSFTVDTTPPDTVIDSGPLGTVTWQSAQFAFSSEPGATFECQLDSGGWSSCTSPKVYSGLSHSSHTFEVRATDGVGNTDATAASRTWRVVASLYRDAVTSTPGLVSYWRLGESSGTTALDEQLANPGTYENGVVLGATGALAGDPNTAATFDGVDDDVALPSLGTSVDFTVEGWSRLTDSSNSYNTLYGRWRSMRLLVRPSGFYASVYFGATEYSVSGTSASNVGTWTYWAFVRSGSTLRIYRNGVELASRNDLPALSVASLEGNIGRQSNLVAYPAKATIDDVAVYNAALSGATVESHALTGSAPDGLTGAGGDATVSLDWADLSAPDLAGYEVYRATASGGPYTKINASTVATSDFADTSVTNGTTYYYIVEGVNTNGDRSAPSSEVTVTPSASLYRDAVTSTPGLLAYWRLGESSGTTALDEQLANPGTYENGVVLGATGALAGDPNTAATFDGVDDEVALPSLGTSVDFTIEGWSRLTDSSNSYNALYGRWRSMRLLVRPSGFYASVYFGTTEYSLSGTSASNVDTWTYWAFVRSGSTLCLYRNGVELASRSDLPALSIASLEGNIGRQSNLVAYPAKATIDDVAVYNAALSGATVQAHYAAGT